MDPRQDRLTPASLAGTRVLVTGGAGFIGRPLCEQLSAAGAKVYSVSRRKQSATPGVTPLQCDLTDLERTRAVIAETRPQIVFHLASDVLGKRDVNVVSSTLQNNLVSTVNLLISAHEANCERVVLTGSLEEPDPGADWPVPSSPYAAAKSAAGLYGRMFNALFGLPVVILRVYMVYGPGQSDRLKLIPYVTTSLLRGETPGITSGAREVDWIYVDDVVSAYVKAATAPGLEGQTVDVGTGRLTTVRQIVEQLYAIITPDQHPEFGNVQDRPMEQVRCADVERSRELLQWAPETSVAAGLRLTVDWYRENND